MTTVIIPYREDRGWLQEAIDSVPAWCELIVEQGDCNKSINFNRALKRATGDIIKILDEDDMIIEEGLKMQIEMLKDYDFIHSNAVYIDKRGKVCGEYHPPKQSPTLKDILARNTIHNPTVLYKRSVFERLGGYDESLPKSQDYEYHLRCLRAGMKLGYCNCYAIYYRMHKKQITRTMKHARRSLRNTIIGGYDTAREG